MRWSELASACSAIGDFPTVAAVFVNAGWTLCFVVPMYNWPYEQGTQYTPHNESGSLTSFTDVQRLNQTTLDSGLTARQAEVLISLKPALKASDRTGNIVAVNALHPIENISKLPI